MGLKTLEIDSEAKEIRIVMDLEQPQRSASGKTMVIASTRGNLTTATCLSGKPITIGLNCYFRP